ncbi:RCC1 domain-containing protein 1-like [Oculina patagonica]
MDESEQKPTTRPAFNSEGSFQCFGFGYNGFGQISPHKSASKGDEVETFPPRSSVAALTPVPLNVDCVSSIVASWSNTFYLKENGTVSTMGWISGSKEFGEVENLLPDHFLTDACCSPTQLACLTKDGDCLLWSSYTNGTSKPAKVENNGTKFKAVGCRESSCILVTGTGQAGFVSNAQVQDGSDTKPVLVFRPIDLTKQITSVACGKEHALLLTSSGVVYSLGSGSRGQLGRGLLVEEQGPEVVPALEGIRIQFIAAGGWHSAAISEFGDLYMWGWNEKGQLGLTVNRDDRQSSSDHVQCQTFPVPINFPDDLEILTVSCGTRHTAAFAGDGSVWTWGWGYYGQLGHGDGEDRSTPTVVAALSSVKSKPKTLCCGAWSTFVKVICRQTTRSLSLHAVTFVEV